MSFISGFLLPTPCSWPYALCLLLYALCPLLYALCPLPFALCALPSALCPLCPLPSAICPMPYALSLLPYTFNLIPAAACRLLYNHHRIAITIEPVISVNRLPIGIQDLLPVGKGRYQH